MLTPGSRIGAYEVVGSLGAGGMGEVYRAHDTILGRGVALKILPDSFAGDPERLARFDREARTLASLNHPHIAQIYGIEIVPRRPGHDGRALVMELVDGDDLSQVIARGPLSIGDALAIAAQIADALEAAHEQRVIHRDLKPANVMVRPDGQVKILDFGLAKALERGPESTPAIVDTPTITSPAVMTNAGTIIGTAAYMSPEQARGRRVDRRADVWAFGCVLYEMLTGRRAFDGEEVTDVLAAVLRDAPALGAMPPVPPAIHRLLQRCLEKDPAKRLDSMHAARLDIDEALEPGAAARSIATHRPTRPLLTAAAILAIGTLAATTYVIGRMSARTAPPTAYFEASLAPSSGLGPKAIFDRPSRQSFTVTNDGARIVFTGIAGETTQLYVRSFDAPEARVIAGTTGAQTPFLSPDNQWVGFLAAGVLRKVPIAGGPVVDITDLTAGSQTATSTLLQRGTDLYGASWGDDDTIVFGRFSDGLWKISANGGAASRLTTVKTAAHRHPHHLPGSRGLLLTVIDDRTDVAVLPQGATEPRVVVESASDGRYVSTSHIVFTRDGLLMAVPFDLDRLAVTGPPFALENDVMEAAGSGRPALNSGAAQFDVTPSGTLVFATGGLYPVEPARLVWVDRVGRIEPLGDEPGSFGLPRLSPDGRRVAVSYVPATPRAPRGIFIFDLARGALTRLTSNGEWSPVWSRDGSNVLFMQSDGVGRIHADGSGAIERLHGELGYPHSVTPDGSTLLVQKGGPDTASDIWMMPLGGDHTLRPLLRTPASEAWAEVSPDGRWLAYGADTSGRYEVYVQPFPGPGSREQISSAGGTSPLWSRDGRELFFLVDGNVPGAAVRLYVVDVTLGQTFSAGKPRELFGGRFARTGGPTAYDVSVDGKRFLFSQYLDPPEQPVTRLRIVLNWFDELRRAERRSR
jgi:serine/threonine-protein kinase